MVVEISLPGRRKRLLHRSGLALIAAFSLAGLVVAWGGPETKPTPAKSSTSPIPVQTTVVASHRVEFARTGLGTVAAWNKATIKPQVSGRIVDVPLVEGGNIRTGDVLVRLDPRPFEAALDLAKAKKAQDEANLLGLEKNLSRDQALLAKGGFSTQQTVDNEQAQVDADKAAVAGDQAAVEAAQLNLDDTIIKAPFSGVASLRNVDAGNVVTPATDIAAIAQIEPIGAVFTLPQADLPELRAAVAQGRPSVLALDQDGKTVLAKGSLAVINNEVDPESGTIRLKAAFDNKDHRLWPGAFVQIRVVTRIEPDAIAVPSDAVQHGPDGPYVWLVSPDETVRTEPVEIQEVQDERTVIGGGLRPGDRIVLAGQYRLAPGARVMVASEVAQAERSGP